MSEVTCLFYPPRREERSTVGQDRLLGLQSARGKYVAYLDADDKFHPTYLEKAVFVLEITGYDVITPWVKMFRKNNSDDIFLDGEKSQWCCGAPVFPDIIYANYCSTVAMLRHSFWKDKAVGYNTDREHYEDWDFWIRMSSKGARFRVMKEYLHFYRTHEASLTASIGNDNSKEVGVIKERWDLLAHDSKKIKKIHTRLNQPIAIGAPLINLIQRKGSIQNKARNMRTVLFALPFVMKGGADNILLKIAKHLCEHGYTNYIITTLETHAAYGDNTKLYEEVSAGVYHLTNFLNNEKEYQLFVHYLLEVKKIDTIFTVGCEFMYHMLPDIKKRYPDIVVIDQLFNEFGHIGNNRRYSHYIDCNIVANAIIKKILIENYHEDERKIGVIIHGVDALSEFNPDTINIPESIYEIIPKNRFIISFMGRFSSEKAPDLFVEIASRLIGLHKDVFFIMTGHGPEYDTIINKIHQLNIDSYFYTPGFVEDSKPLLKLTDVLVIPSSIEGIPIILLEGLSMGKPVVASRVGGIPEIITDGHNGFLCDKDRPEEFVDKISALYLDINHFSEIGANARAYALSAIDERKMTGDYLKIFTEAHKSKTGTDTLCN